MVKNTRTASYFEHIRIKSDVSFLGFKVNRLNSRNVYHLIHVQIDILGYSVLGIQHGEFDFVTCSTWIVSYTKV